MIFRRRRNGALIQIVGRSLASRSRDGWPREGSPEWLALSRRPSSSLESLEPVSVANAMGYSARPLLKRQKIMHPIKESIQSETKKPSRSDGVNRLLNFKMTPRQVKHKLDQSVIGQTEAKKAIAVAISEHYHHARKCLENPALMHRHFHKQNILLFGPSGTGKTTLLQAAAEIANAPFVKADATKFSATGFVGHDVQEVLTQLIDIAQKDIDTARFGIIYFDEIDKICDKPTGLLGGGLHGSVNTRDVQTALLRLMEDYEMPLVQKSSTSSMHDFSPRTFSTKHILFIFSGAFQHTDSREQIPRLQSAHDFVHLGLLPEFVGRCPIRVSLKDLSVSDLKHILARPSDVSPLSRYVDAFANHGVTFTFDDDALDLIAQRAHGHRLGARGLLTETEKTLRHFSYHLPCCATLGLTHFHLDRETVADPKLTLHRILCAYNLDDDDDDSDDFANCDNVVLQPEVKIEEK